MDSRSINILSPSLHRSDKHSRRHVTIDCLPRSHRRRHWARCRSFEHIGDAHLKRGALLGAAEHVQSRPVLLLWTNLASSQPKQCPLNDTNSNHFGFDYFFYCRNYFLKAISFPGSLNKYICCHASCPTTIDQNNSNHNIEASARYG